MSDGVPAPATPSSAGAPSTAAASSGSPAVLLASSAGLTADEVTERVEQGLTNAFRGATSRSVAQILRANVFTIFNAILTATLVVVLLVGNWRDALFGFVLLINTATGTLAEIRAKRALDSLAVLAAPTAHVVRDGAEVDIDVADVVLGDLLRIGSGDQVPADGVVVEDSGVEIDESILTGESVAVRKDAGDRVMSGTTVIAGSALIHVDAVGAQAYANRLATEARKYSVVTSELQAGTNRVLTWISWVIVPMAALLLWSQLRVAGGAGAAWASGEWKGAVVLAVAGVVGMVPQGLVLLTSVNFAAASLTLARRHVLVQELPAVEVLARVDTLCLDKTGTLTSGGVELREILPVGLAAGDAGRAEVDGGGDSHDGADADGGVGRGGADSALAEARSALAALVDGPEANATGKAIATGLDGVAPARAVAEVPFSSARKWSALAVAASGGGGSAHPADGADARTCYVLGAPEIVLARALAPTDGGTVTAGETAGTEAASSAREVMDKVAELAGGGARVVVLARSDQPWGGGKDCDATLPDGLEAVLLAVLAEQVRPDAARTLDYFREQGVTVKVISGDNPTTVAAIAASVGVTGPNGGAPVGVDARTLPSADADGGQALAQALEDGAVFGRVTPEQKRDFVGALQLREHVVAMTGDGVNDALALKDADLGIAMGNGAPATKAVARLVLLDGRFSSLPGVVAEGRRVIANMERVASLFLAKTSYAALIATVVAVAGIAYPYLPRQLTIVSSLTIGIPATIVALAPTKQRYRPGFLGRVLRLAVPAGLVAGAGVLVARMWLVLSGAAEVQVTTGTTLVLVVGGLWLLSSTARPWVWWRALLVGVMAGAAVLIVLLPGTRAFFALAWPTPGTWLVIAVVGAVVCGGIEFIARRSHHDR